MLPYRCGATEQPKNPHGTIFGFLLAMVLASQSAGSAAASGVIKSTSIAQVSSAPRIDGILDDAVWSNAVVVDDLHQMIPAEYEAPSEPTTFLLIYSEDAIYIGVRAFDSQPDEIRAKVLRQGAGLRNEDRVKILIDPYRDGRGGYMFQVNTNGVRLEGIYKGDGFDRNWTGIWHAAAQRQVDGWTAELEIPFRTLSFERDTDWGLNLVRVLVRSNEEMAWSSRNREATPSTAGILRGITGVSQGRGLDIVPTLSTAHGRDFDTGVEDYDIEPSLDVYYKFTSSLNGALTFNTDFSATEVDSRQVNLTRFGLFFPEKRAFFLRESDIFEFGGIGGDDRSSTTARSDRENGRPFFSRRIGLSPEGEPIGLDAGAKASGRVGRWNIGAMAIRQENYEYEDGTDTVGVNATDIIVVRGSASILEELEAGFVFTGGDPRSNKNNTLVGMDFKYRNTRLARGRQVEAGAWYQKTNTSGGDGRNAAYGFHVKAPNRTGWRGELYAKEIQENYDPALGFASRSDIWQYYGGLGYTWQRNSQRIRSLYGGIDFGRISRIDGDLESQNVLLRAFEIETPSGDEITVRHNLQKERLNESFEISDGVVLPVGGYSFSSTEIELRTSENRPFNARIGFEDGGFYDGSIQSLEGAFGWRPSKHFLLETGYTMDNVDLPYGKFTTRLANLEMNVAFTNTLSWVNLLQYDNVSDSIGINSRIHWAPRSGRNLYFVINHSLAKSLPNTGFKSTGTELTFKVDYTFRF